MSDVIQEAATGSGVSAAEDKTMLLVLLLRLLLREVCIVMRRRDRLQMLQPGAIIHICRGMELLMFLVKSLQQD